MIKNAKNAWPDCLIRSGSGPEMLGRLEREGVIQQNYLRSNPAEGHRQRHFHAKWHLERMEDSWGARLIKPKKYGHRLTGRYSSPDFNSISESMTAYSKHQFWSVWAACFLGCSVLVFSLDYGRAQTPKAPPFDGAIPNTNNVSELLLEPPKPTQNQISVAGDFLIGEGKLSVPFRKSPATEI